MPLSMKSYEEKPYNMCLNCAHIGKNCDGPNFLAMSVERWCEWCRLRKEYLGWTNAQVAEKGEISKASVDRVMSGIVKDLRISTMQAVTKALVNGSWGQYPCATAELTEQKTVYVDNPELVKECQTLKAMLNSMTAEHKQDIVAAHSDDQRKIDFLKEQIHFKEEQMKAKDRLIEERYDFLKRKDKVILILSIILAVFVLLVIGALIIDKVNPEIGFFWLRSWFGGEGNSINTLIGKTT